MRLLTSEGYEGANNGMNGSKGGMEPQKDQADVNGTAEASSGHEIREMGSNELAQSSKPQTPKAEAAGPSREVAGPSREVAGPSRQLAQKPSKKFIDEDSKSPEYRSDEWRMKHFKVIPCSKRFAHDWTVCPFAHPGEKARRRDPAQFHYAGLACPDMKRVGWCLRGEHCNFAHNVFEFWMHPGRYRTQACNDAETCQRHACFFAHTPEELRSTPLTRATAIAEKQRENGAFDAVSPPSALHSGFSHNLSSQSTMSQQRSLSISPEDLRAQSQRYNGQDLSVNFANGNRNGHDKDISSMFSELLRDGLQGGQGLAAGSEDETNSRAYQMKIMAAIKALDFNEVQLLLRLANEKMSEELTRQTSDPSLMMQDRLHTPQERQLPSGLNAPNRTRHSPLHTAPAAMEQFMTPNSWLGPQNGYDNSHHADSLYQQQERLLSADMSCLNPRTLEGLNGYGANGYGGLYNQNLGQVFRQQQSNGLARMSGHLSEVTRAPSTNVIARMSQQDASQFNLPYPQTEGLFHNLSATSHNASALQSQLFSLDDVNGQGSGLTNQQPGPSRTTPVASAFQPIASQEWQSLPGRNGQNDMDWRYSGNLSMPSADLRQHSHISEDISMPNPLLTPHQYPAEDSTPQWSRNPFGQGEGDQGLSLPQTNPLLQQRASQLQSGPYDLSSNLGPRPHLG